MNDSTQTLLRSVLKIGSGMLLAKGLTDQSGAESISAGVLALFGVIWGLLHRTSGAKVLGPSLILIPSLLLMPALTGCKTGPDGKRTVDVSKIDDIKTIVEPVASRELRLALVRSPEHATVLAPYIASTASVFCTMSLSNRFEPEFLLDELSKLSDPLLEKVGNGFAVDLKNGAYAGYKLLYGDRFHAEIPEDQWLHKVCEFFCETLTRTLIDAGYPGGVKKSAAGYRRDLNERLKAAASDRTPYASRGSGAAEVIRNPQSAIADPLWISQLQPALLARSR